MCVCWGHVTTRVAANGETSSSAALPACLCLPHVSCLPCPACPPAPHPLCCCRYAKFEMQVHEVARARACYERALEDMGDDANTVREGR